MTEPEGQKQSGTGPQTSGQRLAAKRAAKAARKAAQRGTAPVVPEVVEQNVSAASGWLDDNQRMLWSVGGVAVLTTMVVLTLQMHSEKTSVDAAMALDRAVTTANAPILQEDDARLIETVDESYPTETARAEKSMPAYAALQENHGGTGAAHWGTLGAATALFELGKMKEAEKAFRDAMAQADNDFLKARSLEGVAYSLAEQGRHGEAAGYFDKLAAVGSGAWAPVGNYQRARMAVAQGKREEAVGILSKLVESQKEAKPDTPGPRFERVQEDAETLLAELASEIALPKLRVELPGRDKAEAAEETPEITAEPETAGEEEETAQAPKAEPEAVAPKAAAPAPKAAAPAPKPKAAAPAPKPKAPAPAPEPKAAAPAPAPEPKAAAPAPTPAPAEKPAPAPEPKAAAPAPSPAPAPAEKPAP